MAGEPILIVDDTPVNLKLARIVLANEGYDIRTAETAEEALEILAHFRPRLVLADIQLPGMDGLELTRRLKANENTRGIAVIALTAFAGQADEQKAMDAGCDGYITKPIDTRALGSRIREYLGGEPAEVVPVPQAETDDLRARFLKEGEERTRQLLKDLDGSFNIPEAARSAHQWVGTAGLFGLRGIAVMARELETALAERPVDNSQIRDLLTRLAGAFASADSGGINC